MRRPRSLIGPANMGGMVGLWNASSMIESIQYGTISITSLTATATITSVDASRSILIDLRQSNNWNGGTQPAYTSNTLVFTNATTITASRNASGGIVATASFCVVQFAPGVVRSVQSGLMIGNSNQTATITSVNTAKSLVLSLGLEGDSGGRDDAFYGRLTLTNATTVTLTRGVSNGSGMQAGYLVLEFF